MLLISCEYRDIKQATPASSQANKAPIPQRDIRAWKAEQCSGNQLELLDTLSSALSELGFASGTVVTDVLGDFKDAFSTFGAEFLSNDGPVV